MYRRSVLPPPDFFDHLPIADHHSHGRFAHRFVLGFDHSAKAKILKSTIEFTTEEQ